jgi:hypothetical protein
MSAKAPPNPAAFCAISCSAANRIGRGGDNRLVRLRVVPDAEQVSNAPSIGVDDHGATRAVGVSLGAADAPGRLCVGKAHDRTLLALIVALIEYRPCGEFAAHEITLTNS